MTAIRQPHSRESKSRLTARYQTTVPAEVRKALGLQKGDEVTYYILTNGDVVLRRAPEPENDDPALKPFLRFLERDMTEAPHRIQPVSRKWFDQYQDLTEGVDIDMDAPLPDDE